MYRAAGSLRARPAGGHERSPCVYPIKHHPILRRMRYYVATTRGIRGIVSVRPSVRKWRGGTAHCLTLAQYERTSQCECM
jgi:hypothetical protein